MIFSDHFETAPFPESRRRASANFIIAPPHCGDRFLKFDLSSDETSRTAGRQSFVRIPNKGAVSLRGSEAVLFLWIKNIPKTPETIKESGICSIM